MSSSHAKKALSGLSAWALVVALAAPSPAQSPLRVVVHAPESDLGETPLVVALESGPTPGPYALHPAGDGPMIPANVFADGGKTYLGFVLPEATRGTEQTFTLRPDKAPKTGSAGVQMRTEGVNVAIDAGGTLLTRYVTDQGPKPFYYPLIGPTGTPISRSYPMETVEGETNDHPHQRSLWFTHGKVNDVDFWAETPGHGTIKEVAREAVVSGPGVGLIRTADHWIGPDGAKICEDTRVVRVYDTSAARILDFDITLKATEGPVTLGDTKEGAFGIRVATSMDVTRKEGGKTVKGDGQIVNAEGLTDEDAWGKASSWVDYSGPVDGETVGVAILNHPSSFRYPTTWHVRTYGLFAANPFGWHDFGQAEGGEVTIPKGQSITLRYRLIFHKGDAESAGIDSDFRSYATPPRVDVQAG